MTFFLTYGIVCRLESLKMGEMYEVGDIQANANFVVLIRGLPPHLFAVAVDF